MQRIDPEKEAMALRNDAREGELVFFKDGVYFSNESADIGIPIPEAISKLGSMGYEVVGIAVYKSQVRLLLHPKRAKPKIKMGRKSKFAAYMRRRYWLQKYGCEPPEEKGKRHKEA